tara:strand:- start:280 stop:456 length:177 start_codon:yes stop_codon:yes gene_type:complete
MIKRFINWVKNLFTPKKEEPVVLEETPAEEKKEVVAHCKSHTRFRKNCPDCLSAVGVV